MGAHHPCQVTFISSQNAAEQKSCPTVPSGFIRLLSEWLSNRELYCSRSFLFWLCLRQDLPNRVTTKKPWQMSHFSTLPYPWSSLAPFETWLCPWSLVFSLFRSNQTAPKFCKTLSCEWGFLNPTYLTKVCKCADYDACQAAAIFNQDRDAQQQLIWTWLHLIGWYEPMWDGKEYHLLLRHPEELVQLGFYCYAHGAWLGYIFLPPSSSHGGRPACKYQIWSTDSKESLWKERILKFWTSRSAGLDLFGPWLALILFEFRK